MAGGRIADIFTANNMRDSLGKVIDADGELVGPETVAVANWEISALIFRIFAKVTEALVVPINYFVWNNDTSAMRFAAGHCMRTAFALVNDFAGFAYGIFGLQLLAAAGAGVHKPLSGEFVEDFLEKVKVRTLNAFAVVLESEPGEIFADAVDIFLAGAALIVVFDAKVNLEVPFFCGRPYVKG